MNWIWCLLVIFGKDQAIPRIGYWKEFKWSIFVFLITGVTSPLWYWLTRKHSVLVGGVFEMKYIVVLGVLACLGGQQKPNVNTCIGAILAVLSVYFVSKTK